MKNDIDNVKISFVKRRLVIIKSFYATLAGILIAKLFKLQIIDSLLYKKKANNNALRQEFLLPKRGNIYDRNNRLIAGTKIENKIIYTTMKKNNISNIENIYKVLKRYNRNTNTNYNFIKNKIQKSSQNQKFVLARQLSKEEIIRLKFNEPYLTNAEIEKYWIRHYPFKTLTSSLVGLVNNIKNTNSKVALLSNEYRVGGSGVEKIKESTLGGQIGMKYNVINVTGKKINEINVKEPINGKDVVLTIDQTLQNKLSEMLNGKNGAATLLNVNTGAILAMSSTPNIDPNLTAIGLSNADWDEIIQQNTFSNGMFTNKNLTATYPPGSIFKIIASLAGLMNGIDPKQKYKCTGQHKIGNRVFHCWKAKDGGHGWVDLDTAIAQSCNCYFYNLSEQISNKDIFKIAGKFGLGKKHMPDFSNEASGLVGNAEWLKQKHGKKWLGGDNANLVLGQGYTHLTPLQLAIMVARLATNRLVEPKYLLEDESSYFPSVGFDEEFLDIVRHGLWSVINADYGIIHGIASKKYQICGKTGSAQTVSQRIENEDMRSGKVAIEKHSHALFVGYAPYNNPKFAVSVVVEHGIGGARSAAPIGVEILRQSIIEDQNHEESKT